MMIIWIMMGWVLLSVPLTVGFGHLLAVGRRSTDAIARMGRDLDDVWPAWVPIDSDLAI